MIDDGARRVRPQHWALRPRPYKALVWLAYGIVRVAHGSARLRRQRMVPRSSQEAARVAAAASRRRLTVPRADRVRFAKLNGDRSPACAGSRRGDAVDPEYDASPSRFAASAARRRPRRRLARDPHAAAVPVGVQEPRHRRDGRAGRGEARERRRAAADEGDRRQPRRADGGTRGPARAARRLRAAAAVDHGVHRAARVPVRQGHAARGAHDRARSLPPSARAVAALPPRAPDGRAHARRRARTAWHLDADQLHAVLDPAHARRDRARCRDHGRALRLDVHRDHADARSCSTSPRRSRSPTGARGSGAR